MQNETNNTDSANEEVAAAAPKPSAPTGNRQQRRTMSAIAKRMATRPGRGYTKRGAAQDQIPQRKSETLKLLKAMAQNAQVIDLVASGKFDKTLERDYGPTFTKKYRTKK